MIESNLVLDVVDVPCRYYLSMASEVEYGSGVTDLDLQYMYKIRNISLFTCGTYEYSRRGTIWYLSNQLPLVWYPAQELRPAEVLYSSTVGHSIGE